MQYYYDFYPWRFWDQSTGDEQARQLDWQRLICQTGNVTIGRLCYISRIAYVYTTRLSLGDGSCIAAFSHVTEDVSLGENTTINPYTMIRGKVAIGSGVRIGAHTSILGFNHQHELGIPIWQQGLTFEGIAIGDDVWIGSHVVILDGVTIGSGCIVGAGAVVTRDVPDFAIAVGNPAYVMRDRRDLRNNETPAPHIP